MQWLDSARERWRAIWQSDPEEEPRPERAAAVADPSPTGPTEPPPESLDLERFADRLLGDERIRGALTDDEFQPLLDWALDTLEQVRGLEGGYSAEAAARVEAITSSIREAIAIVNDAFADAAVGNSDRLVEQLEYLPDAIGPPLVPYERVEEARDRISQAVRSLGDGESAPSRPRITEALARALRSLGELDTGGQT